MRRTVTLVIGLLVSALTPASGEQLARLAAPPSAPASRPSTEQEWIGTSIVSTIAGLARFDGAAAPAEPPQVLAPVSFGKRLETAFLVTLTRGTAPISVPIVEHVWSPATYVDVAKRLLGATVSAGPDDDLDARAALTDPRPAVLLDVNARISAHLQSRMRSAAGHEAAALLMSTFALREAAGVFTDVRPALSRTTAHLALARSLRGSAPAGKDGLLASIIVSALVGRQREAHGLVDAFAAHASSRTDQAWVRALKLRITGDWRDTRPSAADTMLEKIEYARALRIRLGIDATLDYLDTLPKDSTTDWHRVAYRNGYNTEAWERFALPGLIREMAEIVEVAARLEVSVDPDSLAVLNATSRPSPIVAAAGHPTVQLLDWSMWAGFLQRHLCQSVVAIARSTGIPDEDGLETLRLYPIVVRAAARTPGEYTRAVSAAQKVAQESPELITAAAWNLLRERPAFTTPPPFPSQAGWFAPSVPIGTGFELDARAILPGTEPRVPVALTAEWARSMPYDHWAIWGHAWHATSTTPPPAQTVAALGPLMEYDVEPLLKMLDYLASEPDLHVSYARRLCAIATAYCGRLGEVLLLLDREPEAAAAYDDWFSRARDRRDVSTGMTWLVRYYLNHGRHERAEEIALAANESRTLSGHSIYAELLERQGKFDKAEELFRHAAEEHAEGRSLLGAFLVRAFTRTGNSILRLEAEALLRDSFPSGVEPLSLDTLPPVPLDGVRPNNLGRRAVSAGLRITDIIVGVDSFRIHGADQYRTAVRFRYDETMTFTVWRDGRYVQLSARVPERWLGTRLTDYRAGR